MYLNLVVLPLWNMLILNIKHKLPQMEKTQLETNSVAAFN